MSLEQKKNARFKLLRALYECSGGDQLKSFPGDELGAAAGLDEAQTLQACEYLQQEGLLEFVAFGPLFGITHRGVKKLEEALECPDRPTRYFMPVMNIGVTVNANQSRSGDKINIAGNVTGSAVGSNACLKARDVKQIQQCGFDGDLKQKFNEAAEALASLNINEGDMSDTTDDLPTLKEEVEKVSKD